MYKWQKAKVLKVYKQTPDFLTLILNPVKFYSFKSGNFVELAVTRNGAYKCYSAVSSPSETGVIEVGVKLFRNGELSPELFKLKAGDELLMRGPTGAHFVWEPSNRTTVAIGGGSGICPMISILRQFDPKLGKLSILFSTKYSSIYYERELAKLSLEKKVKYLLVQTGKESRISKKLLATNYGKMIKPTTDFFVAGPTSFVQDISLWLSELGVAPNNLRTDDFGTEGV
jgi:ferredoxin-NADP reductase